MFIKNRIAAAGVIGALAAAFTLVTPMNPAHASAYTCDGTSTTCLQDLIDLPTTFGPGDTITLANGTYYLTQTLVLNGATLTGSSQANTIIKPSPAFPGTLLSLQVGLGTGSATPLVEATGASVTISNLTIQGPLPASSGVVGVWSNAGAFNLTRVTVALIQESSLSGDQLGNSIVIQGGSEATIDTCKVSDFQKTGILSATSGHVVIKNSTVSGAGETSVVAQNGIQISNGSADLSNNTISDIWYDGTAWVAGGVLANGSAVVTSDHDTFINVQLALSTDGLATATTTALWLNDKSMTDGYGVYAYNGPNKIVMDGVPFDPSSGSYCILYFWDGTTFFASTEVLAYGPAQAPTREPTKPGFIFAGWAETDGTPLSSVASVDDNMNFYAQWTPVPAPLLTVAKTANPVAASALPLKTGDKVTWDLKATNSGNVALTGVVLADSLSSVTLSPADASSTCPVTGSDKSKTDPVALAVGATIHCTATYTVTQSDIDAGGVTNSATVTGNNGTATVTGTSGSVPFTLGSNPLIQLDFDHASLIQNGSAIDFVFKATNIGNVTLYNVNLIEVIFNGNLPGDPPCDVTTLAPGESTLCHALPYTIQPNDIGATITANAKVEGTTADGGTTVTGASTVDDTAIGTFPIPSKHEPQKSHEPQKPSHKNAPSIDLTSNGGALSADGSQITYHFTITNTGDTALSNVTLIQINFTGAGKPSISCAANKLAPGASTTCAVTYTVQPADIGTTVTFTGEAQGTAGNTTVKSDDVPASVDVPAAAPPTTPTSPPTTTPAPPQPPQAPNNGQVVIQTGGSVVSSTAGLAAVVLLCAGAVLLVTRRRLATH